MEIVQYGEWKIAVDIAKTRAYYDRYVVTDSQANRNFAQYCKALSCEEKAFFEALGITPECCEIEHIGVSKKKEFPCGGYYLICGAYLAHPRRELLSIEELAERGFVDDRPDPRIQIGAFLFDFQCEDHPINNLPEQIPDGFLCVRFWCEDMRWLLDEKPESIMYEPPRFWELGKRIREMWKYKRERARELDENRRCLKQTFASLGISYSELDAKAYNAYKNRWIDAFAPADVAKREIKKICLSDRKYCKFLWHIFSYEHLKTEIEQAAACFDAADKCECVLISNTETLGFKLQNAAGITAELLDSFTDITITAADFSWTYSKTHEFDLGPYYYQK